MSSGRSCWESHPCPTPIETRGGAARLPESSPQTKPMGRGGCTGKLLALLVFIFSRAACWPDWPLCPCLGQFTCPCLCLCCSFCQQRFSSCPVVTVSGLLHWPVASWRTRAGPASCLPQAEQRGGCKDGSSPMSQLRPLICGGPVQDNTVTLLTLDPLSPRGRH